jgi:hypothetical protein
MMRCHWREEEVDGKVVRYLLPMCYGSLNDPAECCCEEVDDEELRLPRARTIANLREEAAYWQDRWEEEKEAYADYRRTMKRLRIRNRELWREVHELRRAARGIPPVKLPPVKPF